MMSKQLLAGKPLPQPTATPAAPPTPPSLESALTAAEVLLTARDKDMARLAQFPVTVPALLAKQIVCTDAAARAELKTQISQAALDRRALIDIMQAQEPQLIAARSAVDAGRLDTAPRLVSAFQTRYNAALAAFQGLLAEGSAMAGCLRVDIAMPLPAAIVKGWNPDPIERRNAVHWRADATGIDRPDTLRPVLGDAVAPSLPAAIQRIGVTLDALDRAIEFSSAITSHHRRVQELSFAKSEYGVFDPTGVFKVMRPFNDSLVPHTYGAGDVVSGAIIPSPMLLRLHKTRLVVQVQG